jgi:hypothetical protein
MTDNHLFKSFRTLYDDKIIMERDMPELTKWESTAKRILRAEMARHGMTYSQLVDKLSEIGVAEDERNLRNKTARGKFTAAFLFQCLEAMGTRSVHLVDH